MEHRVDLELISDYFINNAKKGGQQMMKRAMIILTYLAVGRGGKICFLKYADMLWDELFGSPNFNWCQLKTGIQSCMLFAPDYESYKMFFSCYGMFLYDG